MSDDAKSMVPSPPPLQTAQGLHVQASFGPQHRHGWGSFDDSSDGSGQRLAWANRGRHDPLSLRNMSPYGLVQGGFPARAADDVGRGLRPGCSDWRIRGN